MGTGGGGKNDEGDHSTGGAGDTPDRGGKPGHVQTVWTERDRRAALADLGPILDRVSTNAEPESDIDWAGRRLALVGHL